MKLHRMAPLCILLLFTLGAAPAVAPAAKPVQGAPLVVEVRMPEPNPNPRDDRLEQMARADLEQQSRMAEATETIALLTIVQIIVGVASVVGLIYSINLSTKATRAAARATEIAEAELAEVTRPHLVVESVEIGDLLRELQEEDGGYTETGYAVRVLAGRMAWLVADGRVVETVRTGETVEITELEMKPMLWPIKPETGWARSLQRGTGVQLSDDQRRLIRTGEIDLYIYGGVDYKGAPSGKTFEVRFVYKYRPSDRRMIPVEHPFWRAT